MRPTIFSAEVLRRFLRRNRIATLPQLKQLLGTEADITVFRKLKELSYRASYSHRGSFYTLDEIVAFDERGLWSFDSVWFSRRGTLVATAEDGVTQSKAGHFASELEDVLHVPVKEPLLQLVAQGRIARQSVSGLYLYCACDPATRQEQLRARQALPDETDAGSAGIPPGSVSDELRAAIILFASLLDEQQRRLYAGLESLQLGSDRQIAELLGLAPPRLLKDDGSYWPGMWRRTGCGLQAEGASRWKKNAGGDRCDPKTDGKRNRRRPDQWSEVDQKNHRKDRLAA